jgi:hypothetical protein
MRRSPYSVCSALAAAALLLCTACGTPQSGGEAPETGESGVQDSSFQPAGKPKESSPEYPDEQQDIARVRPDLPAPEDFIYLGAFRLPETGERPLTFAYGGEAMTFNPDGDPGGAGDGFPGSLFVMGHNRMPYGELPDGNRLAEVTIPAALISDRVEELPQAQIIQGLTEIDAGLFSAYDEIPRVGIEYLNAPETGPLLHLCWGQHFHDELAAGEPTHAWASVDLVENTSAEAVKGAWYIGSQSPYSVNGYLFSVPREWADEHLDGRLLVSGRFRDGGWSGMGPSLFAYRPWDPVTGEAEPAGSRLDEIPLLQYATSEETDVIERCLEGYQHGDEWEGGAWITTNSGRSAVLFAGTKSAGERYWYGFINPAGPQYPCLQEEFIGQFALCRFSDGTPCPDEADYICREPASGRGWWSTRFISQCILYDPEDLARSARGEMEPWELQPYARFSIDEHLYRNPSGIDTETLGFGPQRRFLIGDVGFDRENGLLYILELFAEEAKPVVHVWRVL